MFGRTTGGIQPHGVVHGIAVRPGDGEQMVEVMEQRAVTGAGLVGDPRAMGRRGITLLSEEKWTDTMREIGADLPWHARRANVLVYGMDLKATIDKVIRVGDILVKVWGETEPCGPMNDVHPGLMEALRLDTRGGVYGEIIYPGVVRLGDPVTIMQPPDPTQAGLQTPQ